MRCVRHGDMERGSEWNWKWKLYNPNSIGILGILSARGLLEVNMGL